MRTKLHPHRHMFDTADKAGTQTLDWTGRLHIFDPLQQAPKDYLQLEARDVGAEAEVLANSEGNVRVRIARDVELERLFEDVLVAIGRGIVERERLAFL